MGKQWTHGALFSPPLGTGNQAIVGAAPEHIDERNQSSMLVEFSYPRANSTTKQLIILPIP